MLTGVCTCKGCPKCQRVLASATPIFWGKVICRNSGFTFQTFESNVMSKVS